MPTMPDVAPLRSTDEAALETYRNNAVQMLCMAGLSGFPQISLPLATATARRWACRCWDPQAVTRA